MNKIFDVIKTFEPFEESQDSIWTHPKFENFVLKSYIDPSIPGGGQDEDEINGIVNKIDKYFDGKEKTLIDIGCGAGLHCVKFDRKGFDVTGVDISQKAIDYAKSKNKENNTNIEYICDDIFNVDFEGEFDISTLLYKTYATFSNEDRSKFLGKVREMLRVDGILIFDIPLVSEFNQYNEINLWAEMPANNIILEERFINLISVKKYPGNLLLNNTIYLTDNENIYSFNDWLQFFTKKEIAVELERNNFRITDFLYEDETHLTIVAKPV